MQGKKNMEAYKNIMIKLSGEELLAGMPLVKFPEAAADLLHACRWLQ